MKSKEKRIRILLVEDDPNLGLLLSEFLEENHCEIKLCRDGESAWRIWGSSKFDFCIFDVMLPKLDGFSLTKKIRAIDKSVPILLLTAKSLKEDKIQGFNLGVDDYLTKPFDEDELLCRINAILNRKSKFERNETDTIQRIGKFYFDYTNQMIKIGTKENRLTKTENEILWYLCNCKKKIAKRDELLMAIWGNADYFTGRSLDVFITKLRKLLREDTNVKIEGIPTVGYILTDNETFTSAENNDPV